MTGYAVTVRISGEDFERLSLNSTRLDTPAGMPGFADRFHDHDRGKFVAPLELEQWRYAYWYDDYTSLILARSFLAATGERFLVVSDEYDPGGWVIFTDYASPGWAKTEER